MPPFLKSSATGFACGCSFRSVSMNFIVVPLLLGAPADRQTRGTDATAGTPLPERDDRAG